MAVFTRYPVLLVSDRQSWVDRLLPTCRDCGAVVELVGWSSAAAVGGPVSAVVADATSPFERKSAVFAEWAARLRYPSCVVSVAPDLGAAEFVWYLRARGYERVEQSAGGEGYGEWVRSGLQDMLGAKLWLVPLVAEQLGTRDPLVVETLCAALEMIPGEVTVDHWARRLGWQTRRRLERLFRERGLPNPKDVLGWLRLLVLADAAEHSPEPLSAVQLAQEHNYTSGRYLRRRIRELTGRGLELVQEVDLEGLLDVMQEKLAAGRGGAPD